MILGFEGQRDKRVTHKGNKLELGLPLPGGSIRRLTLVHSFISTTQRERTFPSPQRVPSQTTTISSRCVHLPDSGYHRLTESFRFDSFDPWAS